MLIYLQKWKQLLGIGELYNISYSIYNFCWKFCVFNNVAGWILPSKLSRRRYLKNRVFILVIFHTGIWWKNLECKKVKMHVLVGADWNRHTEKARFFPWKNCKPFWRYQKCSSREENVHVQSPSSSFMDKVLSEASYNSL